MGMRPGRRRLKGPRVSGTWKTSLRRGGGEEGWDSNYARARRLENELARDIWFEEKMGGGYHSPGMMAEVFHKMWESSERAKAANRRIARAERRRKYRK